MDHDPENEITLMVFRLLVLDLLALFQALNQGLVNMLGHFFEMSKPDAERALNVYKNFTKQMEYVVQYLDVARQHEHATRVEVQALKHVPVHLQRQLEDYVRDPDFEINRRQYLAELDAKKKSGGGSSTSAVARFKTDGASASGSDSKLTSTVNGTTSSQKRAAKPQANKGPDPNLIDFFDSIEQNQTPMQTQVGAQQVQVTGMPYQQTGFQQTGFQQTGFQQAMVTGYPLNGVAPQATGFAGTNPFQQQAFAAAPQPLQPSFTGAGFGGFTPQPAFQPSALVTIPQDSVATFPSTSPTALQPMQTGTQTTNPFRASMIMQQQTGAMPMQTLSMSAPTSPALTRSATNPFARPSTATQAFSPSLPATQEAPAAAPLKPMATGTNPFAKMAAPQAQPQTPTAQAPLVPQATGSTNPFRQGNFVNHNTGMGWQHTQQRIGGGFDEAQTIQVFPRPAHQTPWQQ
jgi:phosphatidylinositol-binding clathrin assembly protein